MGILSLHVMVIQLIASEKMHVMPKYLFITFSLLFLFFLIQFNVPFKIISLIETSQSIGKTKREYPGKTTCLVSHVASAGLEPTPDTAERLSND